MKPILAPRVTGTGSHPKERDGEPVARDYTPPVPGTSQNQWEPVKEEKVTSRTEGIPADWEPPQWAKQFAKHELQWLATDLHKKAQEAHQNAREWQNRATLAEAQLATLRAEYEPEGMEPCS